MLGVLPGLFASGAHVPGRDSILQMRDRREFPAEKAKIQFRLRGFNQGIKRGIERGVVVVVGSAVIGSCAGYLTSADNGFGEIMIYMSINACHGKLDSRYCALVAAIKQDLPTTGRCLSREG